MAFILHNEAFDPLTMPSSPEALFRTDYALGGKLNYRLVLPTGRVVRYENRNYFREFYRRTRKPAPKPNIHTLLSFANLCFAASGLNSKYRHVSEAYSTALFEEAAQNTELRFFSATGKSLSPALILTLKNIVYGLKEDGIKPEDLAKDLERAEDEDIYDPVKLKDIYQLYLKYEETLGDRLLDNAGIINKASAFIKTGMADEPVDLLLFPDTPAIRNNLSKIFPSGPLVLFSGFSEFKEPELELVSLFSAANFPVAVNIDFSKSNGPVFGNLFDTTDKLQAGGFTIHDPESEKNNTTSSDGLHRSVFLRQWLFNTEKVIENTDFSDIVQIIACENRTDEARTIARLVKHLILDKNIPVSDICICMRQPDIYSDLFREVFASYRVPVNISDRFPLSASPVAIAIFSVLEIVLQGYRRNDIHRALSSPYLQFQPDSPHEEIDGANLYDTALKFRIIGGWKKGSAKFWEKRLETAVNSLGKRFAEAEKSESSDPVDIRNIKDELASGKKALADFRTLVKLMPDPPGKMTPGRFAKMIKEEIIEKLGLKSQIMLFRDYSERNEAAISLAEKTALRDELEKDCRAFSALLEILDEMCYILADIYPERAFPLEDLLRHFRTAVASAKYQIREKKGYGVNITTIEQTRGIPFKVLILCGAVDGEFPISYKPEKFLGKELKGSEERHIQAERRQFYDFLTNGPEQLDSGEKQIYISYPGSELEREIVRSPFIDDLLQITSLEQDERILDAREFRKGDYNDYDHRKFDWIDADAGPGDILNKTGLTVFGKINGNLQEILSTAERMNLSDRIEYVIRAIQSPNDNPLDVRIDPESLNEKSRKKLTERPKKPVSISELETYAKCPYKYFSEKLLRLKERKIEDTALTPLEKGSLLHQIVYRFYYVLQQEIREKEQCPANEIIPVRLDPVKYDSYLELLFSIAREETDNITFDHPFFRLEEQELFGTPGKPGRLEVWLQNEISRIRKGWNFAPSFFELGFGLASNYAAGKALPPVTLDEGLLLRGKIDRADVLVKEKGLKLIVADYKLSFSGIPNKRAVIDGTAFQMPLYMAALRMIIKENFGIDAETEGSVYFSFNPDYDPEKGYLSDRFLLLPKDSELASIFLNQFQIRYLPERPAMKQMIEASVRMASEILENIAKGYFNVEPKNNICDYCGMKALCRINTK